MSLLILVIFVIIFLLFVLINSKKEHFQNSQKKLAFCFMIYDKINNEELWYNFFKNIDKSKYNIYIHYKTNKPLKYFEEYKLKNTVETKWCDESLVKAQNLLLEEAIKDKNNTNVLFVSDSCIPLKSFDHIYNNIDLNKSYFNKALSRHINFDKNIKLYKASQWCILTKKHSIKILENKELLKNIFKVIKKINGICPDEYCYISVLYNLNLENELIETQNLSSDAKTFTGWADMSNYKNFSKSQKKGQPNNYSFICPEELDFLINSKSFFGRKFGKHCKGLEKVKNIF